MRRNIGKISLALIALFTLALALPGLAQEPDRDLVPFKISVTGKSNVLMAVPVKPPVATIGGILKGTSEVLGGEVTVTYMDTAYLNVDGTFNRCTNGVMALLGPNGDELYAYWDGVVRPTTDPSVVQGVASFTIRGGMGRFAGVTGSGTISAVINVTTFEETAVLEGLLAMPNKR